MRADSFMYRNLNVVLLSYFISGLNSSSFIFIVASSYFFDVSILVLTFLPALILFRRSL